MTTSFSDPGDASGPARGSDHASQLDDATWAAALRLVLDAPQEARRWAGHDLARVTLVHDLEAITDVVRTMPRPNADAATDTAWGRFREEIETYQRTIAATPYVGTATPLRHQGHPTPVASARFMPRGIPRWIAWSGAALAMALVGIAIRPLMRHVISTPLHSAATYVAPVGAPLTIALADGSRMTLAPQTIARVGAGFGVTSRDVTITGRASFDVTHAAGAPFVVRVGGVMVHVLGTTFDVQRYATDREVRVAVASGKVAVAVSPTQPAAVTLVANMVARIADSSIVVTRDAKLLTDTAWVHGALAFDGAPAGDVLKIVGRWYGYEFRWQDSTLAARPLTARFAGESTADILRTLSTLLDVTMHFDGHVITLIPGQHGDPPTTKGRAPHSAFSFPLEVGR